MGDLDVLRRAAEEAEGVIHMTFGLDMTKMAEMSEEERRALDVFGEVSAGSSRPIVATGGVLLTPPGEVFSEDAQPPSILPSRAPPSKTPLRWRTGDCMRASSAIRARCMDRARRAASCPCSPAWRGRKAFPPL